MGTERGDDERSARRARPRRKALRRALCDAVEGFHPLERDLEVDGRRAADVLGVDGDGGLWLAVLARGAAAPARALEALALARGGAGPLARLIRAAGDGTPRIDVAREVGVVVLAPADDAALLERLAPLGALGVRLVSVSLLVGRSGAASITRAAPITPAAHDAAAEPPARAAREGTGAPAARAASGGDAAGEPRPGFGAFLGALPPAEAERAAHLLRRLARLDDALESDVRGGTVEVSIGGRALCSLTAEDGRLVGEVATERAADTGREAEALAGALDVERFVEAVVGRYLAVTDRKRAEGELDEDDGLGPLPAFETAPPRPVQLLSREEIEAFRF